MPDFTGVRPWLRGLRGKIAASSAILGAGELLVDELGNVYGGNGGALSALKRLVRTDEVAPLLTPVYVVGADPTGATLSDAAFAAAITAAQAKVNTFAAFGASATCGVMIIVPAGYYRVSLGVIKITDSRIGFMGPGAGACSIEAVAGSSNGDLVAIGEATPSTRGGWSVAPVSGFTLRGWNTGANTNGLHYGDRPNSHIKDVRVVGFNGAGSRNVWFRNDNTPTTSGPSMEGSTVEIDSQRGTVLFDFDGAFLVDDGTGTGNKVAVTGSHGGSFDYSTYKLHIVQAADARDTIGVRFTNGAHAMGSKIHISGNVSAGNASFSATALKMGEASTSSIASFDKIGQPGTGDASGVIGSSELSIILESDASTGVCREMVLDAGTVDFQGATTLGSFGIVDCSGIIHYIDSTGTWTIGQNILKHARFAFLGTLRCRSNQGAGSPIGASLKLFNRYVDCDNTSEPMMEFQGGTVPTITKDSAGNLGNGATTTITADSNQVCGKITVTTGSTGTIATFANGARAATLGINRAYGLQPKAIFVSGAQADPAATGASASATAAQKLAPVLIATPSSTDKKSFELHFGNMPAPATTYTFSYLIIG